MSFWIQKAPKKKKEENYKCADETSEKERECVCERVKGKSVKEIVREKRTWRRGEAEEDDLGVKGLGVQ